jgi:hypothetical protein
MFEEDVKLDIYVITENSFNVVRIKEKYHQ